MDNVETMHICQAVDDVDQLHNSATDTPGERITTHKLYAVHLEVFLGLEVLDDVPLIHPLRDEAQPVFADRCSDER